MHVADLSLCRACARQVLHPAGHRAPDLRPQRVLGRARPFDADGERACRHRHGLFFHQPQGRACCPPRVAPSRSQGPAAGLPRGDHCSPPCGGRGAELLSPLRRGFFVRGAGGCGSAARRVSQSWRLAAANTLIIQGDQRGWGELPCTHGSPGPAGGRGRPAH